MQITLKKSVPCEQNILKEFLYLAIYVPPGDPMPEYTILNEPNLARYYQNWGVKDDRALFALSLNEVVGACWSRCFPEENPGYGSIHPDIPELSIAVLPKCRGKGVGTKLLENFLLELYNQYTAVSLSVDESNPAMKLYQRIGFEVFDQKDQSIIMVKKFNS